MTRLVVGLGHTSAGRLHRWRSERQLVVGWSAACRLCHSIIEGLTTPRRHCVGRSVEKNWRFGSVVRWKSETRSGSPGQRGWFSAHGIFFHFYFFETTVRRVAAVPAGCLADHSPPEAWQRRHNVHSAAAHLLALQTHTTLYSLVSSRLKKALSKLPRVERGTWYRLLASYAVEENPRERPTAEKLFQGLWPHACMQRPPSPRAPCLQFASLSRILGPLFYLRPHSSPSSLHRLRFDYLAALLASTQRLPSPRPRQLQR